MSKNKETKINSKTKSKLNSEIKIKYHAETRILKLDQITMNDWNPNFVPTSMMQAIKDDIQKHGFIGSIVVQKQHSSGKKLIIINGEHRYQALKELGAKTVPTTILDVDDDKAMLLTLRLNREHGELMPDKVQTLLETLSPDKDVQLLAELSAMNENEIRSLLNLEIAEARQLASVIPDSTTLQEQRNAMLIEPMQEYFDPNNKERKPNLYLEWRDVFKAVDAIVSYVRRGQTRLDAIIAISRGGIIPASLIQQKLSLDKIDLDVHVAYPEKGKTDIKDPYNAFNRFQNLLFVDDIIDTGQILECVNREMSQEKISKIGGDWYFASLTVKKSKATPEFIEKQRNVIYSLIVPDNRWVVFPWEYF